MIYLLDLGQHRDVVTYDNLEAAKCRRECEGGSRVVLYRALANGAVEKHYENMGWVHDDMAPYKVHVAARKGVGLTL